MTTTSTTAPVTQPTWYGQIRDMFTAARVEMRGETLTENGTKRAVTVADWVRAFKDKRHEIEEQRCPE